MSCKISAKSRNINDLYLPLESPKQMKVTLNLPDSLNLKLFDLSLYVAAKLFEDGILSSGQAAEMVGVSKRAFIEIMGKYGVSVFNESVDDLRRDIGNA